MSVGTQSKQRALVLADRILGHADTQYLPLGVAQALAQQEYHVSLHCRDGLEPAVNLLQDGIDLSTGDALPDVFRYDLVWSQGELLSRAVHQHPIPTAWHTRFVATYLADDGVVDAAHVLPAQLLGAKAIAGNEDIHLQLSELGVESKTIPETAGQDASVLRAFILELLHLPARKGEASAALNAYYANAEQALNHHARRLRLLQHKANAFERLTASAERRAALAQELEAAARKQMRLAKEQLRRAEDVALRAEGRIKAGEKWAAKLDRDIVDLKRYVESLQQYIGSLHHYIGHLEGKAARLSGTIAGMEASLSWRVTKPLRFIARKLRREEAPGIAPQEPEVQSPVQPLEALTPADLEAALPQEQAELPDGFDPDVYRELNRDIDQAGLDAAQHYADYGQYEGRPWQHPTLNILAGTGLDPHKPTALVISPVADRSSVAILSLDLVRALSAQYNVVVLALADGEQLEQLQQAAAELILEPKAKDNYVHATDTIERLCTRHALRFAIANDMASKVTLSALANRYVPAISLLHDIASYTISPFEFQEVLFWSARSVFSNRITLDLTLNAWPHLNQKVVKLLPPGSDLTRSVGAESAPLPPSLDFLHDRSEVERMPVVLGAGPINFENGVDLFLEAASRLVRTQGGRPCKFVWLGTRDASDAGSGYAMHILDQIQRSGLRDHVHIVHDAAPLLAAVKIADVMLVTARLDPQPHAAAQAMHLGLPVVCFDKATGLADALTQNGLAADCVARYLDTVDLTDKVAGLLTDDNKRKAIAAQCMAVANMTYSMDSYLPRLEDIIAEAVDQTRQEKLDAEQIQASGQLRSDYFTRPQDDDSLDIPETRKYIRSWKSNLSARKPRPGIYPGVYAERRLNGRPLIDPFADFLRHDEPPGPWAYPVIRNEPVNRQLAEGTRVALHMHVYYPDLLPDMLERLAVNTVRPDLFITVKDSASKDEVLQTLSSYTGEVVDIQIVPNRGRDIGPFLTAFGRQLVDRYDLVGHLHTKKSFHLSDRDTVAAWRDFLLENLLGGRTGGPMADTILTTMSHNPDIGIAFPDDPYLIGWDANRPSARELAGPLGIRTLPDAFNFPVGTMFWIRSNVLARFVDLGFTWEDYPTEPLPRDGSMLHALERLFGVVPGAMGLQCAGTCVAGISR